MRPTLQDRTLPHFLRGDVTAEGKGFVANSFYSGLTPTGTANACPQLGNCQPTAWLLSLQSLGDVQMNLIGRMAWGCINNIPILLSRGACS